MSLLNQHILQAARKGSSGSEKNISPPSEVESLQPTEPMKQTNVKVNDDLSFNNSYKLRKINKSILFKLQKSEIKVQLLGKDTLRGKFNWAKTKVHSYCCFF